MRFFLDENFPKSAAEFLIAMGHEVLDLRGTGEEGMEDKLLFAKVQEARAVLLTTDRDFFHTIPHLVDSHRGVVVVALRRPNRASILERLQGLMSCLKDSDYENRVFQLRDKTWLAYPPLSEPST